MNLTTNEDLGRRRVARTISGVAPTWASAYARAVESMERFNGAVAAAHAECPRAWLTAGGLEAHQVALAEQRHDVEALSRADDANWRELRRIGESIQALPLRSVAEAAIKLRVLVVLHSSDGEGAFEDGAPVRQILADLERLAER